MPESDVSQKLSEWLRGLEALECERVEIRHMVAGSEGGSVVASFELEGDPPRFNAEAITAKLTSDAEGIGGPQRYTLAGYKAASKAARDTLRLRVDGGADAELGGPSEPANLRGLVAQLMRHNEQQARTNRELASSVPEAMTKMVRVLSEALEQAFAKQVEHWRVMGEQAKYDREATEQKHRLELERERFHVLAQEVKLLTPGLAAKLGFGSPQMTEAATVRFVESLTEQQREVIFGTLTPDQQVALMAVIDAAQKKETKERGEAQASPPAQKGSSNGQS